MPINETVYLHRNHRVCVGKNGNQKIWNKYSYWTHSSDVWFEDGTTLENKMSSLKGITNNINSGAGYAADVSLVKSIRDSLKGLIDNLTNVVNGINNRLGGLRFYEDSNGKWVVGADSVPKKLGSGGLDISIVDIMPPIKIRNGEINNGSDPGSYWGMVSQYDLTVLDGYQDFVFGIDGNMLVVVQSTKVNQYFEYPVSVLPTRQGNFNGSFDMNGYLSDQRDSYINNYLPHYYDDINIVTATATGDYTSTLKRPFEQCNNFALYNPDTGYLYVVTTSTSHASYISLWKK